MFEGCSPEPAGEPLEAPGDGVPRWMVATRHFGVAGQDPAYTPTRPPAICKTVKRKTPTGSVGVFLFGRKLSDRLDDQQRSPVRCRVMAHEREEVIVKNCGHAHSIFCS